MRPLRWSSSNKEAVLWGGFLFLVATFWLPGFVNAGVPKWTAIHLGALVCAVVYLRRPFKIHWAWWTLAGYIGLSLLWSQDWRAGLLGYQKILALGLIGLCWYRWGRGLAEMATVALAGACIGAIGAPQFFGGFGNENFIAEFVLLAGPLGLWSAYKNRGLVRYASLATVVFAAAYLAFLNSSKLEIPALYVFALCFLVYKRKWALTFIWLLLPVNVVLLFPEAVEPLTASALARLELWGPALEMAFQKPLFGWGLGSFDYQFFAFWSPPPWGSSIHFTNYAGAAHNEFLQVWSEFGLLGMAGLLLVRLKYPAWMLFGLCLFGFPMQLPATALLGVLCLSESYRLQTRSAGHTRTRYLAGRWSHYAKTRLRQCAGTFGRTKYTRGTIKSGNKSFLRWPTWLRSEKYD